MGSKPIVCLNDEPADDDKAGDNELDMLMFGSFAS